MSGGMTGRLPLTRTMLDRSAQDGCLLPQTHQELAPAVSDEVLGILRSLTTTAWGSALHSLLAP